MSVYFQYFIRVHQRSQIHCRLALAENYRPNFLRNGVLNCSRFPSCEWYNPDFSNTRLFETPDFSNQKSFPLDLFQSNTVILTLIFRNSRYFELTFSSFQNFTFDFSNFENSGTNKNRPRTHLNAITKFRGRCFRAFFITKPVANLSLKT